MFAMQPELNNKSKETSILNPLIQAEKPDNLVIDDQEIKALDVGQKRKNRIVIIKEPAAKKTCPNSIFEKNSNYLHNCEVFLATIKRCYQNEINITFEQFKKEIANILSDLEKLDPSNNLNNNITTETVDYQKNKQKFDLISNFINKTSDITLTLKFQPMSFINWTTTIGNLIKAEDNLKEKTKTSNRWYWGTVAPLATAIIIGLVNSMTQ